jgi:hypothetical protein
MTIKFAAGLALRITKLDVKDDGLELRLQNQDGNSANAKLMLRKRWAVCLRPESDDSWPCSFGQSHRYKTEDDYAKFRIPPQCLATGLQSDSRSGFLPTDLSSLAATSTRREASAGEIAVRVVGRPCEESHPARI